MQTNLKAILEILETERKAILSGQWRGWLVLLGGIALALATSTYGNALLPLLFLVAGLIYGLITLNKMSARKRDYRIRYKEEVIAVLLHDFGQDIQFTPAAGIALSTFEGALLFKTRVDRYHTEDRISGKKGDTSFYFAEVHAEYKTQTNTKQGRREYWHDIFKGVIFVADFNKAFNGITVVRPKDWSASLGAWFSENIFSFDKQQVIRLENDTFDKDFVTYSNDPIEARYILTPALMEKINELNRRSAYCVSLSFIRSTVYIAFPLKQNYFEPPLFRSLMREGLLDDDRNMLHFMLGIIDDLNLNIRIWSKMT